MNRTVVAIFGSLFVLVAAFAMLSTTGRYRSNDELSSRERAPTSIASGGTVEKGDEPLTMYCAASNRAVIDAICKAYEKEYGRQIQLEYGPSQTLLSKIEVSQSSDLYLPADDSYLTIGRQKKLIEEIIPLAKMRATIAVKKGNPKSIRSFEDLTRKDIRLVQASPDASAIGKLVRAVLTESNLWGKLDKATTAYVTAVTDVANDVAVGAADAGIVYDAVLHPFPSLEAVDIFELETIVSQVSVGVVINTKRPRSALHFARYLAAHDRGGRIYQEHGFTGNAGDTWNDVPELKIYAGSMLRPAIEDTLTAFETREGIQVTRVYNGCGILVAQMQAGDSPDAYFACDREFMKQVRDLFPQPVDVSQNELVILVKKGNPLKIKSLKDLTRKGLRVGVGHEKQCAMGWITQNTFREGGIQKEVMENVTVQTPTGDMLVNQLLTGSLDAAVAYITNATGSADELDAIQIEGIPCSVAVQPWAISTKTQFPQATSRLYDRILSTQSHEIFAAEGFTWLKAEK
jgi:molybdate transport system substrate-binding protein